MGCMLATETFFRGEKSCPFRVSVKSLESPMKKDMLRILDYLCTRLRPGITEHYDLENQMTDFLDNQLLYPYEFPKTAFHIVSNPNTYPHVLALVNFLITEIRKSDDLKNSVLGNKTSLAPIFHAYAAWMAGRPDKEEKALGNLFHQEFSEQERLTRELETAEISNAALQSEIDELRNFAEKISAASEKAAKLSTEDTQLKAANDRKSQAVILVKNKLNELVASRAEKAKNLEIAPEKSGNLVRANPQLSRAKVAETRKQLTTKQAEIDHLAKISSQRISDHRAVEQAIKETQTKLEMAVAEFNRKSNVGKIDWIGNASSAESMLKFSGDESLLISLSKKISSLDSEISERTRLIEARKAEISRVTQAVQGAASDEAELKKKLEKAKRETSEIENDRKNLENALHTSELDFAKSVQKTKELENNVQKLDAEIRRSFQALRETLSSREDASLRASVPVEELRLKQEAELAGKLSEIVKFKDDVDRKLQNFNEAIRDYAEFAVVIPPLELQWN